MLGAVFLPLALIWWLRARGHGGVEYVSQFWYINPYDPELGRIGVADFFSRVAENLKKYGTEHLPLTLMGRMGIGATVLAVLVAGSAAAGWVKRLKRPELTELFVPLYLGLILAWPAVWSGERFLLPVYPLLIAYTAETLVRLVRRVRPGAVAPAGALATMLVLGLAAPSVSEAMGWGRTCMNEFRFGTKYPCLDEVWGDFYDIAEWTEEGLPEDAVVISRKPRLFYGLNGRRGLIYPFSRNPDDFFEAVRQSGARYLVIDQLGGVSARYLGPVLKAEPGAFCQVYVAPNRRAALLGILPEGEWGVIPPGEDLPSCPASYFRDSSS